MATQLATLFDEVGSFYRLRMNLRLTQVADQKFTEKLRSDPSEFHGIKVACVVRTDGLKLVFADGSWVCYRLSGTEPVVRAYSEAHSKEDLAKLSAAAKAWIFD
jgi:phosphomannomutase